MRLQGYRSLRRKWDTHELVEDILVDRLCESAVIHDSEYNSICSPRPLQWSEAKMHGLRMNSFDIEKRSLWLTRIIGPLGRMSINGFTQVPVVADAYLFMVYKASSCSKSSDEYD